ncbi:MAG: hypothetical protein NTW14_12180 [bacterium]|nr:hypothetical protein [bacterium]
MNIAILAALAMEFSTFRWYMGRVSKKPLGIWQHYVWQHLGNRVILLETGIGSENAAGALNLLLRSQPIDCIINFGSAGMIDDGLKVGDVFLAQEIVDGTTGRILKTNAQMNDAISAFLLGEAKRYSCGRLVTSLEPVIKRAHRLKLAEAYAVGAVDMEAYALASVAQDQKIPFTSLKMISDRSNAMTRLEFWKNVPLIDRRLGKLMYGFLEYLQRAA